MNAGEPARGDAIVMAERWFARLRNDNPDPEARLAFDRWLSASPDHRQAWDDICAIWTDIDVLRTEADIMRIRQEALERTRWWDRRRAGMALALVLVFLAGSWWAYDHWDHGVELAVDQIVPAHLVNPIGRRSRILLADGSIVQLDADSVMDVAMNESIRSVDLKRGRALFEVAKDPRHPFIVTASGRAVTALGTKFSVDIQRRDVRVVLAEGRVRVDDRRAGTPARARLSAAMSAGQMLIAGDEGPWHPVAASTDQFLSWTNGQLLFDDARLCDVVVEVNRYSRIQIEIVDPEVDDRRLTAVLRAGDIETLLDGINRLALARIERVGPDRVELRRRVRISAASSTASVRS